MPYYITAKNGSKFLSIPIEDKHQYYDTYNRPGYVLKYDSNTGAGIRVKPDNIIILFDSNNIQMSEGTGEDQRVGNKVLLKKMQHMTTLWINSNEFISNFTHGTSIDFSMKFRLMTVKFDDPKTKSVLADWYNTTYVPNSYGASSNTNYISNQAQMLRESTEYTGTFKIIHDEIFTLNKANSVFYKNLAFTPNKQITFENSTDYMTNDDFINTYTFIITPSNIFTDMDTVSADKCLNLTSGVSNLFTASCNTKISYIDV